MAKTVRRWHDVHRPDWRRTSLIWAGREGDKDSLVRLVEPDEEAGTPTQKEDPMYKTTTTFSITIALCAAGVAIPCFANDVSFGEQIVAVSEPDLGGEDFVITDINGDKKPDLLWRDGSGNLMYSLGQTGANSFGPMALAVSAADAGQLEIADINQDDRPDLIWRDSSGKIKYSLQQSGEHVIARNCKDGQANGNEESGVYTIDPDGPTGRAAFEVYCDMTTNGGGWTLVNRQTNNGPRNGMQNHNDEVPESHGYARYWENMLLKDTEIMVRYKTPDPNGPIAYATLTADCDTTKTQGFCTLKNKSNDKIESFGYRKHGVKNEGSCYQYDGDEAKGGPGWEFWTTIAVEDNSHGWCANCRECGTDDGAWAGRTPDEGGVFEWYIR